MSYELVIGMEIKDDAAYARYREAMAPLLAEHGGGFRYDFKIAEVLRNEAGRAINRVFVIYFKDKAAREAFFARPDYRAIRQQHFDAAVGDTTVIAEYERP